jgi:filamentous hemagglutinin family protein
MERQTTRMPRTGLKKQRQLGMWLLTRTALCAVLVPPAPLFAQTIDPATTPQGGNVVAGTASISQAGTNTTINQGSQNAAIDWQSFNVGANANVQFVQPNASAITLNRVVSSDPSIIAGVITANGQIVIINQSGVVFTKGSEVNAQSLLVATSNISNADFMAGKLNFTGTPNPGASIVNNGTLTAAKAGLVGLVAPQVANNGVITAQLGQVVLAGADAFTLDLYGDRLVSLDVTKSVTQVDLGGKTVTALVTNAGLIVANGGKITLTASSADALVSQLIDDWGVLRADSVGTQAGMISLQAVGGNINIAGSLLARGTTAGTQGGAVGAVATGTVAVGANAVVDVSGQAGGGTIALGTDLARAAQGTSDTTAPKAALVTIAAGATLDASAVETGNGGKVTLLSSKDTEFNGTVAVTGGSLGGNGGTIEISSDGVIALGGTVYDMALNGQAGEITLDPATLMVGTGTPQATLNGTIIGSTIGAGTSYIDAATLDTLGGTIVLEASQLLSVASSIGLAPTLSVLELLSGKDVTIGAAIAMAGALSIAANGTIAVNAGISAGSVALVDAGSANNGVDVINLGGSIVAGGAVVASASSTGNNGTADIVETGGISGSGVTLSAVGGQAGFETINLGGPLNAGSAVVVSASGGANSTNTITQAGLVSGSSITLSATGGTISADTVAIGGTLAGTTVTLASAGDVSEITGGTVSAASLVANGADLYLGNQNALGTLGAVSATGTILLDNASSLSLAGLLTGSQVTLAAAGDMTEVAGGTISAATLTANGTDLYFGNANNVGLFGAVSAAGTILLDNAASLTLAGLLSGSVVTLASTGDISEGGGGVISAGSLVAGGAGLYLGNANSIAVLGGVTTSGTLNLNDNGTLTVAGPVAANQISLTGTVNVSELSTGTITAGNFTTNGTLAGYLSLNSAHNSFAQIGQVAATGNIFLEQTGNMALNGAIATPGELDVLAGGNVTGTNAVLSVGTLGTGGGTIGGTALLTNNGNAIGTLGNFAATGNATVYDGTALNIGGLVYDAGLLTLNEVNHNALSESAGGTLNVGTFSAIGAPSAVDLGNGNVIGTLAALSSTGAVTIGNSGTTSIGGALSAGTGLALLGGSFVEASGVAIGTPTLTSGGGTLTNATLLQSGNSIGTLGALDASGSFALYDGSNLTVAGPVQAGAVTLINGVTNGTLTLDGGISAGSVGLVADKFALGAGGTVVAPGGTIEIAPFTASGTFVVGGTATSLPGALLSAFDTSAAELELGAVGTYGATTLIQTGSVSAPQATLALETSGTLTQLGTLTGQTILLSGSAINATGSIGATALYIETPGNFADSGNLDVILFGGSSGSTILLGPGNLVGTLANLVASVLTIHTGSSLTIDGLVNAGSFALDAGGAVTETGGSISSTLFSAPTIAGALLLTGHNAIGTLGAVSATGAIDLNDPGTLTIAGLVGAGSGITLTGGTVLESGSGVLVAGLLAGSFSGNATLNGANQIGTLGAFTDTGTLAFTDTGALTLGAVNAGAATLSVPTLNVAGPVTVSGVLALMSLASVGETGSGVLDVGTLTTGGTTLGGALSLTSGLDSIGTLGAFAATGGISIIDGSALTIAGLVSTPGQVSLQTNAGNITEAGGAVSAGTLAVNGAGAVQMGGANLVGTLGAVSAGGNVLLNNGEALTLAGLVSTSGTLTLETSTGGVTESGGGLDVGALGGSFAGALALNGANTIGTVEALSATTILLNDSSALAIAGPVSASGALTLDAGGTVSETTGSISAPTLTGDIAGALSLGNANTIGTLGALSATSLLLNDASALNIAGLVSVSNGLTLHGAGVSESGGSLDAASLTTGGATLSGAVSLGGANAIGTLGGFAATGAILLNDASALTLNGAVFTPGILTLEDAGLVSETGAGAIDAGTLSSGGLTDGTLTLGGANVIGTLGAVKASGNILLANNGTLGIGGLVSTASTLTLQSTGAVSELGSGAIDAASLTTGGATIGGAVALTGANTIGTLGAFAATGNIALNNNVALGINGLVATPGTLTLTDAGAVSEITGGSLNVATLTTGAGSIAGALSLGNAGNSIGALGAVNAGGTITLADNSALNIAGLVHTTGQLALETAGAVSETGGTLNVGTLSSGGVTIGGAVGLGNSLNAVGTLGGLLSTGALQLADGGNLTIAGPVQSQSVTLADAGTIALAGSLGAGTLGTVALVANELTANGGTILAAGGVIEIAPFTAGTAVDIGGSSVAGLQLSNALVSALDPSADVIIGSALGHATPSIVTEGAVMFGAPTLALDSTGGIAFNGTLLANLLDVSAGIGISEAAGAGITATTLAGIGAVSGAVALGSTTNAIGTLAGFTLGGDFTLYDGTNLAVTAPVSAANIALTEGAGQTLAVDTMLAASTGGTIGLSADNLVDSGALISAPNGLVAIAPISPGRAVYLGGPGAGLDLSGALLGAVNARELAIATTGSLDVNGAASIAAGTLALSGGGIGLNGTLTLPGVLALASTNGVSDSAGDHLTVGTLLAGGTLNGAVNLGAGTNAIATLGALSLSGTGNDLTLNDATSLTVAGSLSAGNITLGANGLALNSGVRAVGTLDLASAAGVSESGSVDAAVLTSHGGMITGAVALGGANAIGTLANFAASGAVELTDTSALTQTGTLAAPDVTLNAAGIGFNGAVTVPGTLALISSGDVTQPGGTIAVGTLTSTGSTIAGGVTLAQAADVIDLAQNLAASGAIDLASAGTLATGGLVGAGSVTLAGTSLALGGTVSAAGVLSLAGSTANEGAGAVITAGTLTTGAGGITTAAVLDQSGNQIGTLGAFSAQNLTLADGAALTLNGAVNLSGTFSLWDAGAITQTGGSIRTAELTSNGSLIGGNVALTQAGNSLPVVSNVSASGNIALATTGSLVVGGVATPGSLSLNAGGALGQSGSVSAGLLNAGAASIDLPTLNAGTLGTIAASGAVVIGGFGTIAGPLGAASATLGNAGNVVVAGNISVTNGLTLTAGGALDVQAGNVSATTATLSGAGITQSSGSINATSLSLASTGAIAQSGGSLSATNAVLSGTSLTLDGDDNVSGQLALYTPGAILHTGGTLNAGLLTGTAGTLAEFTSTTDIQTIGSFIEQDSLFSLVNDGTLTIIGPLVANLVDISAAGAVVLDGANANSGIFITGNTVASNATTPTPGTDSVILVTGNAPAIIQTGSFYISSGAFEPTAQADLGPAGAPAGTLASVFMSLSSSGTISLQNLVGTGAYVVMAAGPTGQISGNVNLDHLEILSAQSADLTGQLGGLSGQTAAGNGSAYPYPQANYRFNACPIGSYNCTVLPVEVLPAGNPLQNFDISPHKRKRLNKAVVLPGIAARDY